MSSRDKRAQNLRRGKPPTPLCIYCQKRPAVEEEHVIAKGFFGTIPPKCYVKVPACKQCNSGRGDGQPRPMSMDEEYTRTVMANEERAAEHPVAAALLAGEIPRSYENSPAFRDRIAGAMSIGEVRTPQGIIIPNQMTMKVETGRVARVMQKITRGLFYDLHKRPLPVGWPVHVSSPPKVSDIVPVKELMDRCKHKTPVINVGDEKAFMFRGATPDPDQNISVWFLVFYRSIVFVTDTVKRPPK
jgi:hypothetical protein